MHLIPARRHFLIESVGGVAQHAVDVVRRHAGVGHRVADRPGRERSGGLLRTASIAGLADTADGVFDSQIFRR